MSTPTEKLSAAGVSIWLDDLSRERITSGNLTELISTRNVTGVTTNPTIFQGAIGGGGHAYADQIAQLAAKGASVDEAIFAATTGWGTEAGGVVGTGPDTVADATGSGNSDSRRSSVTPGSVAMPVREYGCPSSSHAPTAMLRAISKTNIKRRNIEPPYPCRTPSPDATRLHRPTTPGRATPHCG